MAKTKPLDKDLSYDNLKSICRLKPTLADTAAFFQVSEDTIIRRCNEFESLTFAKFRDKYMVDTRLALSRKAISMAMGGNTAMMIFCLKNLNKWQDKFEIDIEHTVNNFTDWARQMSKQLEAEETKAIDVTPKKEND